MQAPEGTIPPDAVVFDCDGTIADTETPAEDAWRTVLRARGYEPTAQDFGAVIGHPFARTVDHFAGRVDLGPVDRLQVELRATYGALLDRDLAVYPDAVATMRALAASGVPLAVASSSTRAHVERVLDRVGVTVLVAAIVSADDVREHKPYPAPYRVATAMLGVPADRATAVEDTAVGVRSARSAGLFTVAVRRRGVTEASLAEADRVVETIDPRVLERPATRTGVRT